MKIRVKKTEAGRCMIVTDLNGLTGEESVANFHDSRALTGTTDEESDGIFSNEDSVEIYFGSYVKTFTFEPFDFSDGETVERQIRTRVREVRDWVKKCKALEFMYEFEI